MLSDSLHRGKIVKAKQLFSESIAIDIGRRARHEAARWESAVEAYCFACDGNTEDARTVIKSIRGAVER